MTIKAFSSLADSMTVTPESGAGFAGWSAAQSRLLSREGKPTDPFPPVFLTNPAGSGQTCRSQATRPALQCISPRADPRLTGTAGSTARPARLHRPPGKRGPAPGAAGPWPHVPPRGDASSGRPSAASAAGSPSPRTRPLWCRCPPPASPPRTAPPPATPCRQLHLHPLRRHRNGASWTFSYLGAKPELWGSAAASTRGPGRPTGTSPPQGDLPAPARSPRSFLPMAAASAHSGRRVTSATRAGTSRAERQRFSVPAPPSPRGDARAGSGQRTAEEPRTAGKERRGKGGESFSVFKPETAKNTGFRKAHFKLKKKKCQSWQIGYKGDIAHGSAVQNS